MDGGVSIYVSEEASEDVGDAGGRPGGGGGTPTGDTGGE